MIKKIGIVRETKNAWERRVPLIPSDVKEIKKSKGIEIVIQPSPNRIFAEDEYKAAGAIVQESLSECELILGIKEIKIKDLLPEKTYCFFSHTIKGQSYNMPLLQRMLDLRCTLIDYERMVDDQNRRLIYFSYHAGVAGMIETLWACGKRLESEGIANPFTKLRQTLDYKDQAEAEKAFRAVAAEIRQSGIPQDMQPLVVGVTGYGNVSRGAQHMLDLLPVQEISPSDLLALDKSEGKHRDRIYKIVFQEKDMYVPKSDTDHFDLQDYYNHPEKYKADFDKYLPFMTILINATFWDTAYPKHVTKESLKVLDKSRKLGRLRVIGDISCDVQGGVEATLKVTDPGEPVFVFHPQSATITSGFTGKGIMIMAVDNLPSELPMDASVYFSSVLKTLLPPIINVDFSQEFNKLALSDTQKKAIITHQGELTENYKYLKKYL